MDDKVKNKPLLSLFLLDLVGSVLIAIGLAKKISGIDLLPDWLLFKNYDLVFIVVGALLALPYLFHLFTKAREKSEQKLVK